MQVLDFPADRIVGTVAWVGSWTDERGPVLATGTVLVPEEEPVELEVHELERSTPTGNGGWELTATNEPADLGFLRDLPPDALESLTVRDAVEASFGAVAHLAPGLRRLYLSWSGLTDAVLPTVAELTGLTYLQTFGNRFTDQGVQRLATLTNLDHLYLEEATLSVAAFDFATRLPRLTRLGLQDVSITPAEVRELRGRLPGVDVG